MYAEKKNSGTESAVILLRLIYALVTAEDLLEPNRLIVPI